MRSTSRYSYRFLATLILSICVVQQSLAAKPWQQSFNDVSTIIHANSSPQFSSNVAGGINIGSTPIDGLAEFPETTHQGPFGGTITTSGSASYDRQL